MIVEYPDPSLTQVAQTVDFKQNVDNTIQTMYDEMDRQDALGVAAPQMGFDQQIFVYHNRLNNERGCFINPELIETEGRQDIVEGCLSVPGLRFKLGRYKYVTVTGYNEHWEKKTIIATGMTAQIFQHEIDHLQGKLIINYLSRADRRKLKLKG